MSHATARDHLIVALDVPLLDEAYRLVSELGESVSYYKVGLELLFAGGLDLARDLRRQGKSVFLDMKLLDIGNTVERAVANVNRAWRQHADGPWARSENAAARP